MKINFVFTILLFFCSLFLFAGIVPIQEAKKVAINLYAERSNSFKTDIIIETTYILKESEMPFYYVFNMSNNQGFVIISAESNVYPILAYSFYGNYDPKNQAPAFIEWMDNYKKQIHYIRSNKITSTSKIDSIWNIYLSNNYVQTKDIKSVNPLLGLLTWSQSQYYNELCPDSSANGCVATAMGQVMKYWNFPLYGTGCHSYTELATPAIYNCPPTPSYGDITVNFGATKYNWTNMPNFLLSSNNDVAMLLYHCGVSVDMDYSPCGSGTQTSLVANALKKYFSYATSVEYQNEYVVGSWDTWKSLLMTELDAGRPMVYHGYGIGGHSFVCDGYQTSDYYHFNWGWGSDQQLQNNNGWYYLSNLNPGSYDFTNGQGAVIGIKPGAFLNLNKEISCSPTAIIRGQSFTVHTDLKNTGDEDFVGDYLTAIYDLNNQLLIEIEKLENDSLSVNNHYTNGIDFQSSGLNLSAGIYQIAVLYRRTGGEWMYVHGDYSNPINITIIDPLFIDKSEDNNQINVFPNPVKNELIIDMQNSISKNKFEILNIIGQTVYNSTIEKRATVNLSQFPYNVYLIKINTGNSVIVKRFVKE